MTAFTKTAVFQVARDLISRNPAMTDAEVAEQIGARIETFGDVIGEARRQATADSHGVTWHGPPPVDRQSWFADGPRHERPAGKVTTTTVQRPDTAPISGANPVKPEKPAETVATGISRTTVTRKRVPKVQCSGCEQTIAPGDWQYETPVGTLCEPCQFPDEPAE